MAKDILVHDQFSQERPLKKNVGKSVVFSRYSPLARATTALTEGANPSDVNLSATNVSVTAQEYGNWTKISKLVALTAIDPDLKEKVSIMGQNAGETIDRLVREELFSGATVLLANGKAALSAIAASDTLNATDVRKAIRNLKKNKGLRFKDGFYAAIVGPDTSFDLMGDSAWLNAKTYSDVRDLYRGEIGELHGGRFVESTDQKSEASTVTVFSNFFIAMHAYGSVQLEGDEQKIYVKVPGPQSTDNPLDRYSTAGWAQTFASKVLVADWIINLKTAASA
jgi:N4-gp56 family major capsid protein